MPRPRKPRKIFFNPYCLYFKPRCLPLTQLDEVELTPDEIEALRLCDLNSMSQVKAARKMKISQSTINRILLSARKKIADALINGKAIKIMRFTSSSISKEAK